MRLTHFAAAGALALLGVAAGAQTVDLGASLEAGDKAVYRYTTDASRSTTAGPGITDRQDIQMTMRLALEVESVDERGARVNATIESLLVQAQGTQLQGEFDSSVPAADREDTAMNRALSPAVGHTIVFRLDRNMEVLDLDGLGAVTPPDGEEWTIFQQVLDKESIIRNAQNIFGLRFRPSTADVGESWTETVRAAAAFGFLRADTRKTVEGVSEGVANVDVSGEVVLEGSGAGRGAGMPEISESSIRGGASWDLEAGALRSYDVAVRMKMDTGDADGPGPRLAVAADMSGSVTIVRLDDPE